MYDGRQPHSGRRRLLKIFQRVRFDQRPFGSQLFAERDILRRPLRLEQDQQHRVIGRQVVTAGRVDFESAAGRLELSQKDRREIERVVLHELLERKGLRRFEKCMVSRNRIADSAIGQLCSDLIELLRR